MSQTIYFEYFDMIIDEIVTTCKYCHHEPVNDSNDICLGCELSLELLDSCLVLAEA